MGDKKDISSRFIYALGELIKQGKVSDKKAFAASVGCSTSMITEISKGRSNVGISVLQNTVLLYEISATWLLVGTGEMFIKEHKELCEDNQVVNLMHLIDKKDDTIRQQAECIGKLRAENEQLKGRLQKSAAGAHTVPTANAV